MPRSETTAEQVILNQVRSVCSDGNSDAPRLACDIIAALGDAGFRIVPVGLLLDQIAADAREMKLND